MMTSNKYQKLLPIILDGVCMSMGIAIVVENIVGEIDIVNAVTMLALGLFCSGLSLLIKHTGYNKE